MGFVHVHYDNGVAVPGWPKVTVRLEHLEPSDEGPFTKVRWLMLDDLGYELPDGVAGDPRFLVAPAHEPGRSTDLASVPKWLWGVIASFGQHTMAALLHDHLCDEARSAGAPASKHLRREADRVFRIAMADLGVPGPRRWLMWAAVRLFGEAGQPGVLAKAPAALVLALTVAVWTTIVMLAVGATDVGVRVILAALVAAVIAALTTALGRRNDLGAAILVGAAGGLLVAPALAVSFVTVLLLDAPALLAWAIRWLASRAPGSRVRDPGPPPRMGPMQAA